jgi:hypothetical protein
MHAYIHTYTQRIANKIGTQVSRPTHADKFKSAYAELKLALARAHTQQAPKDVNDASTKLVKVCICLVCICAAAF